MTATMIARIRLLLRLSNRDATTHRSFSHASIMVERVESAVKLAAEVSSHHATVLDDHEHRIQKVEGRP